MCAGIHTCLSFQECAHVVFLLLLLSCVCVCVRTCRQAIGGIVISSSSLHLQCVSTLPAMLFTFTPSHCSQGTCSHTHILHMYVLYVCVPFFFFKSLILCEFATQTSGRSSAHGCYPPSPPPHHHPLLPSPRQKQACARCPVNNHPSVLPDFCSISRLFILRFLI